MQIPRLTELGKMCFFVCLFKFEATEQTNIKKNMYSCIIAKSLVNDRVSVSNLEILLGVRDYLSS